MSSLSCLQSYLQTCQGFQQLGEDFYSLVQPSWISNPRLVHASASAANLLGLSNQDLATDDFLQLASGNQLLDQQQPLAMVYSGHQFGSYVPRLGDGRAILLATVNGPQGNWELQLKGAGKTPYSRFGDGRAVLRSTIREYLCSEAMHGLGIATTRALSIAVGTDQIQRETVESAATMIRLARSHIRFGSFEYFHYTGQHIQVKQLADFIIAQHYPDLAGHDSPYKEFFQRIVTHTAKLIAHWQSVGFAHGVMNTDNMSILGDTLDYGPYGFLDNYNPDFICNHSDHNGRYAFNRQPGIGLWNCNALAHALSSLISSDDLKTALEQYQPHFLDNYLQLMRNKLGLAIAQPNDGQLIDQLLEIMAANNVDYTLFFRRLCAFNTDAENDEIRQFFDNPSAFDQWVQQYTARLLQQPGSSNERQAAMRLANPKYILRNYMAEVAIRKAEDQQDYSEIDRLLTILTTPFEEHPEMESYAGLPPEWSKDISISCSS